MRVANLLEEADVPYAVMGGNAVAAWVSTVDEAAVRNTRDVDILIRRSDLPLAKKALEAAGFRYRQVAGVDMFLDGPDASARDAVHVVFAGEVVRPQGLAPNPDVTEAESTGTMRVISLQALVRVKLTAFRDKDRTHVRDLIDVGLVDSSWIQTLPSGLAARLQSLLDTPEG